MRKGFRFAGFLLALCMLCALLGGCMDANVAVPQPVEAALQATAEPSAAPEQSLDENGSYTSRDDVALYIHSYGHLPPNFVTKDEARGAERIVFSNDGLIYYTGDHYETFELLYGTP